MNDTRYLYEVRPVRPIIVSGKSVRIPCSIQLTKAEVLEYMKSGAVYRKFLNTTLEPIRVTGENLDRLHQAFYCKAETKPESVVVNEYPVTKKEVESTSEPEKKLNEEGSSTTSDETSSEDESDTTAETESVAEESTEVETETTDEVISEETKAVVEEASSENETTDEVATETEETSEKVETEKPAQAPVAQINAKNNKHNKNYYKK